MRLPARVRRVLAVGGRARRAFDRVVPFLAIVIAAWALTVADSAVDASVEVARDACERQNVIRENQAGATQEQIDQTRASLKGDLGPLEPFRQQIKDSITLRESRLRLLRESVSDQAARGRPYAVDCEAAFP